MSTVENGVIRQLSVSQTERFDHNQKGGCQRAWWFERVHDMKPDSTVATSAGDAGHELFAHFFRHGALPEGRHAMKKAVTYAILKGDLPKPGADMLVEWRGDGQQKYHPTEKNEDGTPKWIPLDVTKTLWLGGLPWELFTDLAFCRGDIPTVMDHKFSADPATYAKRDDELIKTVQLPGYVLGLINAGHWAGAKRWRIAHNYNGRTAGTQFYRQAIVTMDQILERKADIENVVGQMKVIATAKSQEDVPFNRKSCDNWMGCPHQSICSAFKENKMALTDKEKAIFDDLGLDGPAEAPPAAVSDGGLFDDTPSAPVEDDEEAAALAALAAVKAKKAAKAAADAAAAKAKADAEAAAKVAAEAEAKKPKRANMQIVDKGDPSEHPICAPCGAVLNRENGSKRQDGSWVHIGCPQASVAVLPPDAPSSDPAKASEQPAPPAAPKGRKASGVELPGAITLTVTLDAKQFEVLRALFEK